MRSTDSHGKDWKRGLYSGVDSNGRIEKNICNHNSNVKRKTDKMQKMGKCRYIVVLIILREIPDLQHLSQIFYKLDQMRGGHNDNTVKLVVTSRDLLQKSWSSQASGMSPRKCDPISRSAASSRCTCQEVSDDR